MSTSVVRVAMRKTVLIIAALAAVLAIGVAVHRLTRSDEEMGATAVAQRGSIERIVVASGTIEPEDLVDVRAKISGIVEHFHADAGDRVKAGQVIAEIDRDTLEAAVREAGAVLQEAEVTRDHAALERRRKEDLLARGVESRETVDRVRAEHAAADARVARASATLERLEQELAYATITAPFDGLVLRRELNAGAAVASVASVTGGTVLMTIADTSKMHLLGIVDENEIALVRVGMEARIRTDAYPDRVFPGRVRKIASLGDRKDNVTSFKIEVDVLAGVEQLWPRLSGDADVITEVRPAALIVPEAALVYEGNDAFVDVVERASEPRLSRRRVRPGIFSGDRVEIVEGLRSGDRVKLH